MAKLPFMKLYIDDWLADTKRLSTIEQGAYFLLVCEYWRDQKSLIDDDDELSCICGMSIEEFKKIKPRLMKYFKEKNGRLIHSKVERVLKESKEAHKKRREAGRLGGKAKAKQSSSNAKAMHKQPEPEPEPEPEPDNKDILSIDNKQDISSSTSAPEDENLKWINSDGIQYLAQTQKRPLPELKTILEGWIKFHNAVDVRTAIMQAQVSVRGDPVNYVIQILKNKKTSVGTVSAVKKPKRKNWG